MTVWAAVFWGGVAAGAVLLGQLLAPSLQGRERVTGLLMGFGAGTLLAAVAYELIPEANLGLSAGLGFALGAVTYFALDSIVDGAGGKERSGIGEPEAAGSGSAMFIGALLDGVPESFILGLGIAGGEGVSVAFLAAVIFSNVPEGAAGTLSMQRAGMSNRRITTMWAGLAVTGAIAAGLGFLAADRIPQHGVVLQAFAAGAMLVMLADSMMPEAFEHGGRTVGLLTVAGFLVAGTLSVAG